MTVTFARTVTFSCAHRYFNPQLNDDENRRLYGSLYRADGFGHNFLLEAHFEGEIDSKTGMIVNLTDVDRWLKDVATVLDHKHLNEIPEFRNVSPTPERIAQWFYSALEPRVTAHVSELRSRGDSRLVTLAKIRLHEGDALWIDYGP
ncbi:MAG: 6-carboxytetrahydropterin synthase [Bdellovibrionota bacterium]|mgnify:CR=1 FL=1